ncbi:MAG: DUF3306 domain-containing protein [Betaproteobacteria bacterium]|nr:DUF3306 domain-containing protein [Betaproteobacteria bacterium]
MAIEDKKKEDFLSRWSRLKKDAETRQPEPPRPEVKDEPPPKLPPVESLTPESDFSGFLHPKVDEKIRRAALKKLFSDPRFNVMDGLDVYIDDYSQADPIPPEMLKKLNQYIELVQGGEKAGEKQDQQPEKPKETPPALAVSEAPALSGPNADGGVPETVSDPSNRDNLSQVRRPKQT